MVEFLIILLSLNLTTTATIDLANLVEEQQEDIDDLEAQAEESAETAKLGLDHLSKINMEYGDAPRRGVYIVSAALVLLWMFGLCGRIGGYGDEEEVAPNEEDLKWQGKVANKAAKKAARARSNAYAALEARIQRVEAMQKAEAHLVTEKLVAGKGRKRKIKAAENGMPAQYKWRRKRKR